MTRKQHRIIYNYGLFRKRNKSVCGTERRFEKVFNLGYAPGGSHTAAAGAERRRYRTAPEGAATGSTEKETRDGIMILEVR